MTKLPRECRLSEKARAEHERVFNDPDLKGSLTWHIAGRALLAAELLEPGETRSMTSMARNVVRPKTRSSRQARRMPRH